MLKNRIVILSLLTFGLIVPTACVTEAEELGEPTALEDDRAESLASDELEHFEVGAVYVCSPDGEACVASDVELTTPAAEAHHEPTAGADGGAWYNHETPQAGPICPDLCGSWTHVGNCFVNGKVANKCMRRCNDCVDEWLEYHCTLSPCSSLN